MFVNEIVYVVFWHLWTLEILIALNCSNGAGIVTSRTAVKHVSWVRSQILSMFLEYFTKFFIMQWRWIQITVYLIQHWYVTISLLGYFQCLLTHSSIQFLESFHSFILHICKWIDLRCLAWLFHERMFDEWELCTCWCRNVLGGIQWVEIVFRSITWF